MRVSIEGLVIWRCPAAETGEEKELNFATTGVAGGTESQIGVMPLHEVVELVCPDPLAIQTVEFVAHLRKPEHSLTIN